MKAHSAFAALALSLLCCGCVAALVPLAAGGALVGTQSGGKKLAGAASASVSETASPVAIAQPAEPTAGSPVSPALPEGTLGQGTFDVLKLAALPAPSESAPVAPPAANGYLAFTDYVARQTKIAPSQVGRKSAILADPALLNGDVEPCYGQPVAVLIDIDPAGDIFDPTAPLAIDPSLRESIRQLDEASVKLLWISDISDNFAADVVRSLALAGIAGVTPASLLLGSGEAGRKQALRTAAAARYCIIAIAGDERADFDEVYEYLRDPDAAIALEPLYGKGWFLTPAPLLPADIPSAEKAN